MSIGSRIKDLREEKGLTRPELAELLNVTVGSISNYENDVSSPKEPILFKIIEMLGCDANYLFQDVVKITERENDVTLAEYDHIKKYRDLDDFGRETVDITLDRETKRVTSLKNRDKRIEELENTPASTVIDIQPHLEVKAAHQRTDIEVTEEMIKHDDDIMDDDDF